MSSIQNAYNVFCACSPSQQQKIEYYNYDLTNAIRSKSKEEGYLAAAATVTLIALPVIAALELIFMLIANTFIYMANCRIEEAQNPNPPANNGENQPLVNNEPGGQIPPPPPAPPVVPPPSILPTARPVNTPARTNLLDAINGRQQNPLAGLKKPDTSEGQPNNANQQAPRGLTGMAAILANNPAFQARTKATRTDE